MACGASGYRRDNFGNQITKPSPLDEAQGTAAEVPLQHGVYHSSHPMQHSAQH
jgi:hypothetical protein